MNVEDYYFIIIHARIIKQTTLKINVLYRIQICEREESDFRFFLLHLNLIKSLVFIHFRMICKNLKEKINKMMYSFNC